MFVVCCVLSDDGTVTIRSLDLEEVSRNVTGRWDGKLSLPQAVLDAMPEARGVEVTMFSDVPPGSGIGIIIGIGSEYAQTDG
jgi:D-glycero-alpha-D-manno-heptose-7-phosphate kinase